MNDPKRLKSLTNQQQLADSLACIERQNAAKRAVEDAKNVSEMHDLAPTALLKLESKGGDVNKLTIKEITAILLVSYNIEMSKGKKKDYVKKLEGEINRNTHESQLAGPSITSSTTVDGDENSGSESMSCDES